MKNTFGTRLLLAAIMLAGVYLAGLLLHLIPVT